MRRWVHRVTLYNPEFQNPWRVPPEERSPVVQRMIRKIPRFMDPETERIETLDDLLFQIGLQIDLAEDGELDWTPKQLATARRFEDDVSLMAGFLHLEQGE